MKLIDKDALVAEIEKRIKKFRENKDAISIVKTNTYKGLFSFINAKEVKEVDLEKEIDDAFLENKCNITDNVSLREFERIAKHFFELGVDASNPLTWEDVKLIWNITDEMDNMPEEEFYKEVLKRFKEKKG